MVAATVLPNTKDFLHQRQSATDSLFDFYKEEIFTYPLSNNFNLICLQNSNLFPRQSVVRFGKQMTELYDKENFVFYIIFCISKNILNILYNILNIFVL